MKKYFISIILGLLIISSAFARSTGCKEGNCENGYGKWIYTDKTTMKVSGFKPKSKGKEQKLGQMDIFIKVNLIIVYGVVREF